ncbi:MAG TPA: hypothetical protein PK771_11195, partial [Spirochaetota bacterium]|nr:hypothetical protein [Spirochaetota bacterium]
KSLLGLLKPPALQVVVDYYKNRLNFMLIFKRNGKTLLKINTYFIKMYYNKNIHFKLRKKFSWR